MQRIYKKYITPVFTAFASLNCDLEVAPTLDGGPAAALDVDNEEPPVGQDELSEGDDEPNEAPQPSDEERIRGLPNPDAAWMVKGLIERHLAGYPGGMSEPESRFAAALLEDPVPDEYLRGVVSATESQRELFARHMSLLDVEDISPARALDATLVERVIRLGPTELTSGEHQEPVALGEDCKYSIMSAQIKSYRCADDEFLENGCDNEEVYVHWMSVGPNWWKRNRSATKGYMLPNTVSWLQKFYPVGSADVGGVPLKGMLLFQQPVEDDSAGPSSVESINMLTTVRAAVAGVVADWSNPGKYKTTAASIFQHHADLLLKGNSIAADDGASVVVDAWTPSDLYYTTNGMAKYPEPPSLFSLKAIRTFILAYKYYGVVVRESLMSGGSWGVGYQIWRDC